MDSIRHASPRLTGHLKLPTKRAVFILCVFSLLLWFHHVQTSDTHPLDLHDSSDPCIQTGMRAKNDSAHETFPRKIWQTSRTYSNPGAESAVESWLEKNQNFRYERITQDNDESYVRDRLTGYGKVVETLLQLSDGMLRADLVQYMFLLAEGGIYTDLDTVCLKPIEHWIPAQFEKDVGFVIGIEGDCLGGDIIPGFSHCVQFATWTMMVKPGHFIMEMLMNHVAEKIQQLAKDQETTISDIKASYMDVIDTTGPGVFAANIYKGLSILSNTNVTSSNITGLKSPKIIGDVLIFPITAFAAGIGHSGAGQLSDDAALVQHKFMASWKKNRTSDHLNIPGVN